MSVHTDNAAIDAQARELARSVVMAMARVFDLKTGIGIRANDDFSKIITDLQPTFVEILRGIRSAGQ